MQNNNCWKEICKRTEIEIAVTTQLRSTIVCRQTLYEYVCSAKHGPWRRKIRISCWRLTWMLSMDSAHSLAAKDNKRRSNKTDGNDKDCNGTEAKHVWLETNGRLINNVSFGIMGGKSRRMKLCRKCLDDAGDWCRTDIQTLRRTARVRKQW